MRRFATCCAASLALAGCAELKFSDLPDTDRSGNTLSSKKGYLPFYEQSVFLVVNTVRLPDGSCGAAGQLFSMVDPTKKHFIRPRSGYGSGNLTAAFSSGVLTSFGQQTDSTKAVSDVATLAGLVGFGPAGAAAASPLSKAATGSGGTNDLIGRIQVGKDGKFQIAPPSQSKGAEQTEQPKPCVTLNTSGLYRFTGTGFEKVDLNLAQQAFTSGNVDLKQLVPPVSPATAVDAVKATASK